VSTRTRSFGVSRRENHDSSPYYGRALVSIVESDDRHVAHPDVANEVFEHSAEKMVELPDDSVALMVTSPPYHVGKDYDSDASFEEYLQLLERVFTETYRVLQPGGRAVVNVANLGRRPYVPLSHEVTSLMMKIGFHMRAEVIWQKARGAGGNCAWGSWRSAANPVIRDVHEYCLCFSKGRFDRVVKGASDISSDDFLASTLSIWEIPPESASRVHHPAPFPVELPKRFIQLYTFRGEWVLDPFMGSGSTAVASVRTGRKWVGYDISAEYCAITRSRAAEAEAALASDPPGTTGD
jgi:DNA modification methylase